jgi:hypothetical protein
VVGRRFFAAERRVTVARGWSEPKANETPWLKNLLAVSQQVANDGYPLDETPTKLLQVMWLHLVPTRKIGLTEMS